MKERSFKFKEDIEVYEEAERVRIIEEYEKSKKKG